MFSTGISCKHVGQLTIASGFATIFWVATSVYFFLRKSNRFPRSFLNHDCHSARADKWLAAASDCSFEAQYQLKLNTNRGTGIDLQSADRGFAKLTKPLHHCNSI